MIYGIVISCSNVRILIQLPEKTEPEIPLWNTVGCNSPNPILSCQNERTHDRGPGNVVATTEDDFSHPMLLKRKRTCAVVGSSGNVLHHEWGQEIDKHEIIARINYPQVEGYEKHVGSRPADIQFFGDKVSRCYNESNENTSLLVFPLPYGKGRRKTSFDYCKKNARMKMYALSRYVFDTAMKMIYNYTISITSPDKRGSVSKQKRATSGFRAVVFCLLICDNVDVYGFGWNKGQERLHYYDANPPKLYAFGFEHWHNSDAEVAIMNFWPNHTHPAYLEQFGKVRLIQ